MVATGRCPLETRYGTWAPILRCGRPAYDAWCIEHLVEYGYLTIDYDDDDLDFARETLGPHASEDEVQELATKRAHVAAMESRFPRN
jgi:hypothetical protein